MPFDSETQSRPGAVRCELDELLLLPGRYRVNVALYLHGEPQDHVEAVFFSVAPGTLRGRPVASTPARRGPDPPPLEVPSAVRSPARRGRPMKILVAGWFSFENGHATAGDVLARGVVTRWLDKQGWQYDVAAAAPFHGDVRWELTPRDAYDAVVFVRAISVRRARGALLTPFRRHSCPRAQPLVARTPRQLEPLPLPLGARQLADGETGSRVPERRAPRSGRRRLQG